MGKLISLISVPFSYFINFLLNITNSFPLAVILFSVIFSLFYGFLSSVQANISARMVFANRYVKKFQERYINDKNVFDTYLTKIYKACRVNQLSNIIFGIVLFILFLGVANLVFSPLTSIFRVSDNSMQLTQSFLTTNFKAPKDMSQYGILDFIFQNKEKLIGSDLSSINYILQYKLDFAGYSFFAAPSASSIMILLPISYLLMFANSIIKSLKKAIKTKKKSAFLGFGFSTFIFLTIFATAFLFPISYIIFIVIYRVVSLLITPLQRKIIKKRFSKIEKDLSEKCDKIVDEAEQVFISNPDNLKYLEEEKNKEKTKTEETDKQEENKKDTEVKDSEEKEKLYSENTESNGGGAFEK